MARDETRLTKKRLQCCKVGKDLAALGHEAGNWNNVFVAKMAAEILRLRRKLARSR